MPAHWGALSQVVQKKGLPKAMAGGSSASISMFLLESLSLNPLLENNTQKSLMIKSFQGYFEALTQTAEGQALMAMVGDASALKEVIGKEGGSFRSSRS